MLKIFSLFIILSVVGYVTIWVKKDPGAIAIEWHGWLIETSVPIIISITVLLFLSSIFIYWIFKKVFSIPKTIKVNYKTKKTNKAKNIIIKAFSAKSMGEIELAEKLSKEAKYLNNTPLKLLLDTEINNYSGNENTYIQDLTKMLDYPETMLLGVKNLSNFYFNKGNLKKATKIIERTLHSKNTPNWFFLTALKLNILDKNWEGILKNLKYIDKYTKIGNAEIKHIKSRIYLFKASENNEDNNTMNFKDIDLSLKFDPSFAPSIIFKARLLYKKDNRLGLNYIKKSWKKFSHPDIANFVSEIYNDRPKNELLNIIKNLTKLNNNTFINNLAIAKVAISIGSWSVARQSIKIIPEKDWTKDVYIMMADLEKKEHGNISKSNYWIKKAENANLDYAWGCTSCTYVSKSWSLICPKCNNVNTIKWQQFSQYEGSIDKKNSIEMIKPNGIIGELKTGIER
jgi:HemY protein